MKVIGISGKAGHGKDFLAKLCLNITEKKLGKKTLIWSFANLLKARVYGESRGEVSFEDVWYNKPPIVRERLQKSGTEQGREVYGEDFWMLQTEALIRVFEEQSNVEVVIIPDVRFENEVMFCHLAGKAVSRFDDECWETAQKVHGYTPELEQEYLRNKDVDGLIELEQTVSELQSMLFNAQMEKGKAVRIRSDRPTLTGEAAKHKSEIALDKTSDLMFDWLIVNNTDTTQEELEETLTPLIEAYLGG